MFFGIIIWLVVIVIIVVRYVRAAEAEGQGFNMAKNRQNTPQIQGKWTSSKPAAERPQQPIARPAQPQSTTYSQPMQPQSTMYSRPAQPQSRAYNQPAQPQNTAYSRSGGSAGEDENSILQKARANAAGHFDDDTLQQRGAAKLERVPQGSEIVRDKALENHIHSIHEYDHNVELHNQPGVDDFDTYHLVEEVNDLIVKGYSGNLEFERDFLAEGMDLLNRVSM